MSSKRDSGAAADRRVEPASGRGPGALPRVGVLAELAPADGDLQDLQDLQGGVDPLARARHPATRGTRDPKSIDAGEAGVARGRDASRSPASPPPPPAAVPEALGSSTAGSSAVGSSAVGSSTAAPSESGELVVQGGGAVSGRWRRTSIAGVAGIARSRVSRAARRSAAGKNGRERDQLELAFEGNPATVAPESVPPEFRVPASSRYSVIAPIPVPPPSPAKPRRLVPLRAVPAAYVVPSVIRGGASQRGGRLLGSRLRSTLSAAYRELRLFVAPPTPGVRLQPVLSNPATTARLAPELRGFRDRSSAASARSGADRGGSEWGEQLALAGGLLAAIALAWFLG